MVASKSSTPSPAKLAANRRNALKSTGPGAAAGKCRAILNAITRDLCPEQLERQLWAGGGDPREFCRLHRDIFRTEDRADALATQSPGAKPSEPNLAKLLFFSEIAEKEAKRTQLDCGLS